MGLVPWDELPEEMRTEEVRPYYDSLAKKRGQLVLKRVLDVAGSAALLVVLSPVMLVLAAAIRLDSPGPVFFRQERVTRYGRRFRIFKFRTMVADAESRGAQVTSGADPRVTRVGAVVRKYRLDEFPQLIDVLRGTMSFVGTRPEVPRYVAAYTPEMMATLLLPAGVTSRSSVEYKDEAELLEGAADPDAAYVAEVLPGKMEINLQSVREFGIMDDLKTVCSTVFSVFGKGDA